MLRELRLIADDLDVAGPELRLPISPEKAVSELVEGAWNL